MKVFVDISKRIIIVYKEYEVTSMSSESDIELKRLKTKDENINFDKLKIKELQQDNEFLIRNNIELIAEVERLDRIARKKNEKYDELKLIYKDKVKELQDLRK